MSYTQSETTTCYGTTIKRFVDSSGNYPIINRKYIPADGSKFQKLGFTEIKRVKSPGKDTFYSVIRNGNRNNYSLEQFKELLKKLNIQEVKGLTAKEFIGGLKRFILR